MISVKNAGKNIRDMPPKNFVAQNAAKPSIAELALYVKKSLGITDKNIARKNVRQKHRQKK